MMQQQDPVEFAWLQSKIKGAQSILEIGSHSGESLLGLAAACEPGAIIRSIDLGTHAPDQLQNAINHLSGRFDAAWYRGDSHSEEARAWAAVWAPYDLVFIDGDHSFEGVMSDWRDYGPMGRMVAFHDINSHDLGVRQLWEVLRILGVVRGGTEERICSPMGIGLIRMKHPAGFARPINE